MPSKFVIRTAVLTVFAAALYKLILGNLLFVSLGVGRVLQPISDFPYTCRRIYHEDLQSCEDLWLDSDGRALYAACSTPEGRLNWMPAIRVLNPEKRHLGDHISVLDIDKPGVDGLFGLRKLKPIGYTGATGDDSLDLAGFDVETFHDSDIRRLYLVNHRPSVDADGNFLDHSRTGANSTIEIFDVVPGENEMKHVRTISHPKIWSPNNVAHDGRGGFFYTNDRSDKVRWTRELDFFFGGGNVGYCSPKGKCYISNFFGFTFPNGLVRGEDDLYYVPSSFIDQIRVMERLENDELKEIDVLTTGMPVDNLSVDFEGDIWAAGISNSWSLVKMMLDPRGYNAASTAFRIRKTSGGYTVEKMIEDRDGEVLGGVTTVRYDVKTKRLFMGGNFAPYLVVCDPKLPSTGR